MLPLCHCIKKIENNFVWETTFENQMLSFGGIDNLIFLVMKKKPNDVGQNGWWQSCSQFKNMCHTHIKHLLILVHTNAPPKVLIAPPCLVEWAWGYWQCYLLPPGVCSSWGYMGLVVYCNQFPVCPLKVSIHPGLPWKVSSSWGLFWMGSW